MHAGEGSSPLLLLSHNAEEMFGKQTSVSAPLFVQKQHHMGEDCRLEGGNPYGNFLVFDYRRAEVELARSHPSPVFLRIGNVIGKGRVPMSGSCRIDGIVHSGHAHSMTGTFSFCRNRHPLMRDDAFLLHVLCSPPLSPAMACIEKVPSSAYCIGRPSSALHIRLFRLKLSHKKKNDIDADNFFLSRQKCRTGEIWAFYGVLPLFSFSFPGCRLSPSFFSFFFFLSPQKKRKKADVFLSLCPSFLRKGKKKTSVQGREKSVTDNIPETLFFFVFVFCFLFAFSPPCPFPDGFPEERNFSASASHALRKAESRL